MRFIGLLVMVAGLWAGDPLTIRPIVFMPTFSDKPGDELLALLRERSSKSAAASLQLSKKTWKPAANGLAPFKDGNEQTIRSPCGQARVLAWSVAFGLGTAEDRQAWTTETLYLIRSLCAAHKAHGGVWGDSWQSALWMTNLARAGWFLGPALDEETGNKLAACIAHEARQWQTKPALGWRTGQKMGGDSKGEENAWNSGILLMAAVMLRDHPDRDVWLRQACSYIVTSVARERDLIDERVVNGRRIRDWATAWCLSDEGFVANHNIYPHPGYTLSSVASDNAVTMLTMAGMETPRLLAHNLDVIYHGMTTVTWEVPKYHQPGPVYQPDGSLHWPGGPGEIERAKEVGGYANLDRLVRIFELTEGPMAKAAEWEKIHLTAPQPLGAKRVNSGIDSGSLTQYLFRSIYLSGKIRISDAATAAGVNK